jgi:hypothetical protein
VQIMCSRGCGYPVDITKEALEEMIELGQPVSVGHEVCPNSPEAPKKTYKIVTQVWEVDGPDGDELVASMGEEVQAPTFREAALPLGQSMQGQWARIVGMTDTIDGIEPSAPEADEILLDGYGRCKGCGSQEPLEVLAQLEGYHSSECQKEHEEQEEPSGG